MEQAVAMTVALAVGAKLLHLWADPDYRAACLRWLTLQDPLGPDLWRSHRQKELGLFILFGIAFYGIKKVWT